MTESEDVTIARQAVAAVVVTYNPNMPKLCQLLSMLLPQVGTLVVVDNGSAAGLLEGLPDGVVVIDLDTNRGIGAAQNEGIIECLKRGAEAIVFFDQDSTIGPALIGGLSACFSDDQVNITAPVSFDSVHGFGYPIVDVAANGARRKYLPESLDKSLDVSVAISSGTMVRAKVFVEVGMLDEGLFIDYVDTEWCLRCARAGFKVRINPKVSMRHSIGDSVRGLAGFKVPVHSPERRYYRVRNALLLFRYPHVPSRMLVREVVVGFVQQCLLVVMEPRRKDYARYYIAAIRDGLKGRNGPLVTR
ncbi:glycosyltransferase family 2 protein [Pseudomonas saliphila]|uniref:glycosyltransferase family 2 protein n=1 Tax=Pseudomonas saliphila TaxID=2586906 RepID=UPI00123B0682|nr:glycosyltransferase family 2 protein [Pseudomonas saliphila]